MSPKAKAKKTKKGKKKSQITEETTDATVDPNVENESIEGAESTQKEDVNYIEDPFGYKNIEIEEAQNNDDLVLVEDAAEEDSDSESNSDAEDIVDQVLDEIAHADSENESDSDSDVEAKAESSEDSESESESEENDSEEAQFDLPELQANIETLLFLSDRPLSAKKLKSMLGDDRPMKQINAAIKGLKELYSNRGHGVELVSVSGALQFRTKISQAEVAKKLAKVQIQKLSRGAMESLAITAYNQPVMKDDIDKIRGVDSSYFIRNLLDRNLISMSGRSELPGRPILYSTTSTFLELFGIDSLSDLPPLAELENMIPASETDDPEAEPPEIKKLRSLVTEMKEDDSRIEYDPKEDERIVAEMKEQIKAIPTSSQFIEDEKQAKKDAIQAKKDAKKQKELELEEQTAAAAVAEASVVSESASNAEETPSEPTQS